MDTSRIIRSPLPTKVSNRYLRLIAPSKSKPLTPRIIQYYPSGKHHCSCPGWQWFRRTGEHEKKCRHHKMTTIPFSPSNTLRQLVYALKIAKNKAKKLYVTWGFVSCQFPEHRPQQSVHCSKCVLYPTYCNIHPIYFGSRSSSKPLIWKLQTAIYLGKRKKATRLLRKFLKVINAIKGGLA